MVKHVSLRHLVGVSNIEHLDFSFVHINDLKKKTTLHLDNFETYGKAAKIVQFL
jgi:hypothetical protein